MGLISRVSSRTYRKKKFTMASKVKGAPTKMRQVNLAEDLLGDSQKSYMKEWNEYYFMKNLNNAANKTRKRGIAGCIFAIAGGVYVLGLNRFTIHGDDLMSEIDKEYAMKK